MYLVCAILFCYVIATTTAAGLSPRSVNVNLETVLQFDSKDNSADVKFIDNIQQFLGKVKTVIDNKPGRRYQRKPETSIKFTDFIKNAIDILKTYSDDDLEDVVDIIDHEVRKYHYKGCKFHELVQNGDLRRYVASKLSSVQNKDGKAIKKSLNNILETLEDAQYDYKNSELLEYINSLYRNNDGEKMKSFLNEIQTYGVKSKRANLDLLRIVRNGIRGIIFDHYSNLNPNARRELKIKIESFWSHQKEVTTEATTKKKFNIANSFNFLRDFTFEFVTPESFTTTTTEYKKPTEPSQSKKEFVDETRQKTNKSPEDMPNYTDSEELEEKKTTTEKPKKKEKKKDKHKKKKEHKRKKEAHVTVVDENLSPKRKHKSKKHKGRHVFRQHDSRPSNVFDYEAVINVRAQTDESDSTELWKQNESISSDSDKLKSKKFRTKDFRKNIAPESEEGLSIDFTPSPLNLSRHTERTTKLDDVLLRRLNNLEKVVKIFKSKINNDDNKEIDITPNIIKGESTTIETTETNQPPASTRRSPVALAFVQDTKTIPTWQKLSQQVRDIEAKILKPKALPFTQDSSTTEIISTEQKQSQSVQNIETTPAWEHKPTNTYKTNQSAITTEEISTTTPKIVENQSNTTNQNDLNDVVQRANNLQNKNDTNSDDNETDNKKKFDEVIGKYNLTKDLLDDFKQNFDNINPMTTNDIQTIYRADDKDKLVNRKKDLSASKENKKDSIATIGNTKNSSEGIERLHASDSTKVVMAGNSDSNENDFKMDRVRDKLQRDMETLSGKKNNGNGIVNSNFMIHEFDL